MTTHKLGLIVATLLALAGCSNDGSYGPLPSSGTPAPAPDPTATGSAGTTGYTELQDLTPDEIAAACTLECPAAPPGEPGPAGEPGASCTVQPDPAGALVTCGDQSVVVPSGSEGPAGPAGERGERGETGSVGPAGPVGATGAQGVPGERGATGVPGAPGVDGADGVVDPSMLYERSDSAGVSNDTTNLFVYCDAGDIVLTGGCLTNAGQGGIVRTSYPLTQSDIDSGNASAQGWVCSVGASGYVLATAKAICLAVD